MRVPRIYHPVSLLGQTQCELTEEAANHVGRVLRMQVGERLELFDGSNHIYLSVITQVSKKAVGVEILDRQF
ncbi:ribosomal RNA small subunit methyltransferase E [Avibacterium gallinarum]|nr:ribosomal RNA small subunit methyltransferase E [Avibacterium gallinarum]